MALPHHHQSIRKRIQKNKNAFPHPNRWVRSLDSLVIVLGFLNGVATIPQVLKVWVEKDASGLSLISWSYYSLFAVVLLLYGLVHREKPIIMTYAFGIILYTLIVVGIVLYG